MAVPAWRPQALAALEDLSRHQSNSDVAQYLVGMYASPGEREKLLPLMEVYCPAEPNFCSGIAFNPWYIGLHGDPRFEQLAKKYGTMPSDDPPAAASSGASRA